MGGGAVLEAMAGLCHHSEWVHVQFEVKMTPEGESEMHIFAHLAEHTTIALFTECTGTTGQQSTWSCLKLS